MQFLDYIVVWDFWNLIFFLSITLFIKTKNKNVNIKY